MRKREIAIALCMLPVWCLVAVPIGAGLALLGGLERRLA